MGATTNNSNIIFNIGDNNVSRLTDCIEDCFYQKDTRKKDQERLKLMNKISSLESELSKAKALMNIQLVMIKKLVGK